MGKKHRTRKPAIIPVQKVADTVDSMRWFRITILSSLLIFLFFLPWLPMSPVINNQTRQFFWLLNFSYFLLLVTVIGCYLGWVRFPRNKYFLPIGILLVVKIISTLFSISLLRSVWGAYGVWSDGLVYFGSLAAIGFCISSLELKLKETLLLLHVVLFQGFVMSLLTLKEGWSMGLFRELVRPNSPLRNSDYFLSFGLLLLPLSFYLWFQCIRNGRPWKRITPYTANLIVLGLAMFITLPAALQDMVLELHPTAERSQSTIESTAGFLTNPSNAERWAEWDAGLKIGYKYPILGSGPGTTQLAFFGLQREGYRIMGDERGLTVHHPHNDLIEQFSQTGIAGLLSYTAIWVTLVYYYIKKRNSLEHGQKLIAASLFWGLMLFLLFNIFLFTTVYTGLIATIWIIVLILVLGETRMEDIMRAGFLRKYSPAVFLFICSANMWFVWSYQEAERASNQASLSHLAGQIRASVAHSTKAAERFSPEPFYNWQAGYYNLYAYVNPGEEILKGEFSTLAQQAIYYSRKSTNIDLDTPQYLLDQGIAEYYLAAEDSNDEQLGLMHIREAESRSPMLHTMYLRAASYLAKKGNAVEATAQLKTALETAPEEKITEIKTLLSEFIQQNKTQ